MTAAFRLTTQARRGFRAIGFDVEKRFGPDLAERVANRVERALKRLAANPHIGHRREEPTRDERILFWPVGPTRIAYRSTPEGVEILFVERGEVDWKRKLRER